MIPAFKLYFYPFLLCLNDDVEKTLARIAMFIADYFCLNEQDLCERTKRNSNTKHMSRINYCASYLKRLELVSSKSKGKYSITDKGKALLEKKGDSLTRDDLRFFPEYASMQNKRTSLDMVYVKEHYSKEGKIIPGYWCNIKNISKKNREKAITDTIEFQNKNNKK